MHATQTPGLEFWFQLNLFLERSKESIRGEGGVKFAHAARLGSRSGYTNNALCLAGALSTSCWHAATIANVHLCTTLNVLQLRLYGYHFVAIGTQLLTYSSFIIYESKSHITLPMLSLCRVKLIKLHFQSFNPDAVKHRTMAVLLH